MPKIKLKEFLALFNGIHLLNFQLYNTDNHEYIGDEENFDGHKYISAYKDWYVTGIDGPDEYGVLCIYLTKEQEAI